AVRRHAWARLQAVASSRRVPQLPLNLPPHLDFAVAHPQPQCRLGVSGGTAQGDAIREAIAARVPGADDTPILDPTLVKRTALMSTAVEQGIQRSALADEQDLDSRSFD